MKSVKANSTQIKNVNSELYTIDNTGSHTVNFSLLKFL